MPCLKQPEAAQATVLPQSSWALEPPRSTNDCRDCTLRRPHAGGPFSPARGGAASPDYKRANDCCPPARPDPGPPVTHVADSDCHFKFACVKKSTSNSKCVSAMMPSLSSSAPRANSDVLILLKVQRIGQNLPTWQSNKPEACTRSQPLQVLQNSHLGV